MVASVSLTPALRRIHCRCHDNECQYISMYLSAPLEERSDNPIQVPHRSIGSVVTMVIQVPYRSIGSKVTMHPCFIPNILTR